MRVEFTAGLDDHDRRIESVLRRLLPNQPLAAVHKALRTGDVRINGAKADAHTKVFQGDKVCVWEALLPQPGGPGPALSGAPGRSLPPEWVLFENKDWVVINKPSGLLVHPGEARGKDQGEKPLDERVRAWLAGEPKTSLGFRPGPLHRLDRETSGIVVFSRSLIGARTFSSALANRKVTKGYLAVLTGHLEAPREINDSLVRDDRTRTTRSGAGIDAVTTFVPLAWAPGLTCAAVDLGTGRTHQIRTHAQTAGHPLAGDRKYGGGSPPIGLGVPWFLHAWKLSCEFFPEITAPLEPAQALWIKKTFKFVP